MLIRLCTHTVIAFLGFLLGYYFWQPSPPAPSNHLLSEQTLVAVVEGNRVYKVTSPVLIVPAFVVISPTGQAVAIK